MHMRIITVALIDYRCKNTNNLGVIKKKKP